jgi:ketosteroid isomerase-like protein
MRPARAIYPVLVAALAMAGCGGGGGSDKQKIESTITSYYKAFGSGDGAGACKQLTKDAIKLLEKSAGGQKCQDVLDAARKRPAYVRIAPKLKQARVVTVKVTGKDATAVTRIPGAGKNGAAATITVPLKKEGDSWRIVSTSGGG